MVDPSAFVSPLANAAGSAGEYLEFWKDYKGEEILICEHRITMGGNKHGNIRQTSHITRGTVSDITSFPPGFLLKDVEECIEFSDVHVMFGAGSVKPQGSSEGVSGRQPLREIDEKYVSFNPIEEIERAEAADSATEPFQRDREENE